MSGSGIKLSNLVELTAADLEPTLREHLASAPAVAKPVAAIFGLASETAVRTICDSLDTDVIDMLAGAWCQAAALRGYKDASKHPPDQTAIVNLGEHAISATEEPVIEMTRVHPIDIAALLRKRLMRRSVGKPRRRRHRHPA